MFEDAFEKLELEETAAILDQVNPEFEGSIFDPIQTTIMAVDLKFYPGFRLLDIADYSVMPTMRRFVVHSPDMFTVLDFTNQSIYKLNAEVPVDLGEDNIKEYVRFFFSYVRGKHGRFLICESADDINWSEDPPPAARNALGKLIIPITLDKKDGDSLYHMRVSMIFKDSLFKGRVQVSAEGYVELFDEELLVEDIPVVDDTLGQ